MTRLSPQPSEPGTGNRQRVLVLYENAAAREHGAAFCSQLCRQGTPDVEVRWFEFALLSDENDARNAIDEAAEADFIVFAALDAGEMPQEVRLWTESALAARCEHEGFIVGLFEQRPGSAAQMAGGFEVYLRRAAHRAGMDYLSQPPPTAARIIPDSLDSYSQRARQVTSVLDEILHTHPVPAPPP